MTARSESAGVPRSITPNGPTAGGARLAAGTLFIAALAMLFLHLLQRERSPVHQPVSFYFHGRAGWLLPIALGAFGATSLAVSRSLKSSGIHRPVTALRIFGVGILVTCVVPCDPWFPWEATPSAAGIIHAIAAVAAPPFLVLPMLTFGNAGAAGHSRRPAGKVLLVGYISGMLASTASLAVGFFRDASPPYIGLGERVLAASAVGWLYLVIRSLRRP